MNLRFLQVSTKIQRNHDRGECFNAKQAHRDCADMRRLFGAYAKLVQRLFSARPALDQAEENAGERRTSTRRAGELKI